MPLRPGQDVGAGGGLLALGADEAAVLKHAAVGREVRRGEEAVLPEGGVAGVRDALRTGVRKGGGVLWEELIETTSVLERRSRFPLGLNPAAEQCRPNAGNTKAHTRKAATRSPLE